MLCHHKARLAALKRHANSHAVCHHKAVCCHLCLAMAVSSGPRVPLGALSSPRLVNAKGHIFPSNDMHVLSTTLAWHAGSATKIGQSTLGTSSRLKIPSWPSAYVSAQGQCSSLPHKGHTASLGRSTWPQLLAAQGRTPPNP
jgi:hypothetical protein